MRPLNLLILTLLAISLSGCAGLPSQPVGNTCIVDVMRVGADCDPIGAEDPKAFVSFDKMDNYVCHSPDSWENVQVYIGDLQASAKGKCRP